jgi:hypothetical protein
MREERNIEGERCECRDRGQRHEGGQERKDVACVDRVANMSIRPFVAQRLWYVSTPREIESTPFYDVAGPFVEAQ